MNFKKIFVFFIISGFVLFNSCDFPYTPDPEISIAVKDTIYNGSDFKIFPINGSRQTCNPAISQDIVNFKGCMLWLNFSGPLEQNVPDQFADYGDFAGHHDRITITDTSNTVRWFIKNEELGLGADEELQDPEWAVHPQYLVCLASSGLGQNWSCYAIHIQTKDTLNLCHEEMDMVSTPHLWVDGSVNYAGGRVENSFNEKNGIVDRESVRAFFGTDSVKLVFSLNEQRVLSLYYVDYSDGAEMVKLNCPHNREGWNFESPMISPDGKWIVYNGYENVRYYETWIQELAPESRPILLGESICDPHWWVHPDDKTLTYIIYLSVVGSNFVREDLSDPEIAKTGEAGTTFIQQVKLFAGRSTLAGFRKIDSPEVVINLPMKGGLSPDGEFICTGYDRAYIAKLY